MPSRQIKFSGETLQRVKTAPTARLKQNSKFTPHVGAKQLRKLSKS
jgi:hypothetical protein